MDTVNYAGKKKKKKKKTFGETSNPDGHKIFFSGREDKHEHGVGFLIYKDTVMPSWDAVQSPADLLLFV